MKLFTLIYLLILLGKNAICQDYDGINCIIQAKDTILKIGEVPEINIVFENNTDTTIYLIKSLDASSHKWRYPHAYYTIEKLDDKNYSMELISRCGNMDGINVADFIKIKPTEKFSPVKINHSYFSDFSANNPNNFKEKGKYKITYHYSSISDDLTDYMGDDMRMNIFDFETSKVDSINPPSFIFNVNKKYEKQISELEKLLSKVPKIEIESNSIIIEVR